MVLLPRYPRRIAYHPRGVIYPHFGNHCSTVTPLVKRSLHKGSLIKPQYSLGSGTLFTLKSLALIMEFSNLWKHYYRFTHAFFTRYKTTCLSDISNHRPAALHTKMSAFNSHMRQNAFNHYLKWNFEYLLTCYCYATKTNIRKIRSHVS